MNQLRYQERSKPCFWVTRMNHRCSFCKGSEKIPVVLFTRKALQAGISTATIAIPPTTTGTTWVGHCIVMQLINLLLFCYTMHAADHVSCHHCHHAAAQLHDINQKTGFSLVPETDIWTVGLDLLCMHLRGNIHHRMLSASISQSGRCVEATDILSQSFSG